MNRILTPITLAATAGALALGAAGGAVAASAATPTPTKAQIQTRCEQRATIRTKLRDAFEAERQKENVFRLEPTKRKEIARPILDGAVKSGTLRPRAEARIMALLGRPSKRP
jgi:hypothetical protein